MIYVTPGGEDEAETAGIPFMGVLGILVLVNIAGVFLYCFYM